MREKENRAPFFFLLLLSCSLYFPTSLSLTNNNSYFSSTTHFFPLIFYISTRNNNNMLHVPYVAGGSVRTFSRPFDITTTTTNRLQTRCDSFASSKGISNTKSTYTHSFLRLQLDNSHRSALQPDVWCFCLRPHVWPGLARSYEQGIRLIMTLVYLTQ